MYIPLAKPFLLFLVSSFCSVQRLRGMQLVGPLNAVPAKALPEDLHSFLGTPVRPTSPAKAGQTPGAVYVSMGTVVRLTEAEVVGMAANLAALQRPVIWKLDAAELPGMPPCQGLQIQNSADTLCPLSVAGLLRTDCSKLESAT